MPGVQFKNPSLALLKSMEVLPLSSVWAAPGKTFLCQPRLSFKGIIAFFYKYKEILAYKSVLIEELSFWRNGCISDEQKPLISLIMWKEEAINKPGIHEHYCFSSKGDVGMCIFFNPVKTWTLTRRMCTHHKLCFTASHPECMKAL